MKQLSLFCSRDLEDRVIAALDGAGVEGFFRVGEGTGNKFLPPGQVPRCMTWEAVMFVVPAAADDRIEAIVGELERYAGSCEIEPCLRIVVAPVEKVR